MTFDARESGAYTGAPIELYEFRYGPTTYRYTSDATDYVAGTAVYEAIPISRGPIELTQEVPRTAPRITIDARAALLAAFKAGMPADYVTATIYRLHRGDSEAIVLWTGRVLSVAWDGATATMHCESVLTSIKRTGLRRMYQRQCPHVLYSSQCGALQASFELQSTVQSVSGSTLTLTAFAPPEGYYIGGFLAWETPSGRIERRAITAHASGIVTISYPIPGIAPGAEVLLYPGCDHTLQTCGAKFSNAANYGGFPYIPSKNPFGGTSVF